MGLAWLLEVVLSPPACRSCVQVVRTSRHLLMDPSQHVDVYGPPCDLWACGVILYMLLSGEAPFWNEETPQLLIAIARGEFDFSSPQWSTISSEAKDLIRRLLVVDPAKRATAEQVSSTAWQRLVPA